LPAVDIVKIKPKYLQEDGKIVIGHFPRGKDKGTNEINKVVKLFAKSNSTFKERFVYAFSNSRVTWEENLKRMAACDIYIESLSQGSATTNKHDWSITALEAAALGKLVITNFDHGRLAWYKEEYGPCPLRVANSAKGLGRRITRLLYMNWKQIREIQHQMRKWVETQHSYEAIGKRLKDALGV